MRATPTSRATLTPMAIAGGVLGFVLILALTLTTSRVIDAAIHLDLDVIAFLGRFARRSRVVDTFIWTVWTNAALQGGVVMVLVWGVWFSCGEAPAGRRKRETMLSSLIGMYACLLLTLVFRVILPFRARPAMDQAAAFQMPYLPDGMIHVPEAGRSLAGFENARPPRGSSRLRYCLPPTAIFWAPLCDRYPGGSRPRDRNRSSGQRATPQRFARAASAGMVGDTSGGVLQPLFPLLPGHRDGFRVRKDCSASRR